MSSATTRHDLIVACIEHAEKELTSPSDAGTEPAISKPSGTPVRKQHLDALDTSIAPRHSSTTTSPSAHTPGFSPADDNLSTTVATSVTGGSKKRKKRTKHKTKTAPTTTAVSEQIQGTDHLTLSEPGNNTEGQQNSTLRNRKTYPYKVNYQSPAEALQSGENTAGQGTTAGPAKTIGAPQQAPTVPAAKAFFVWIGETLLMYLKFLVVCALIVLPFWLGSFLAPSIAGEYVLAFVAFAAVIVYIQPEKEQIIDIAKSIWEATVGSSAAATVPASATLPADEPETAPTE